jgi:hypothetical protein
MGTRGQGVENEERLFPFRQLPIYSFPPHDYCVATTKPYGNPSSLGRRQTTPLGRGLRA